MRIYGDERSGNCLKVKYTADHLGLPYDWVAIDILKGETRSEAFLAMNPMGRIPVLRLDDGRVLAESNAIILHLAEGSALIPTDPFDRAKMHELLFWEQYSHEPYIAVCRYQVHMLGRATSEREVWRVERGESALDLMESLLTGHDWFVAGRLTLADIALLAYTRLAHEGGFDLAPRPNVRSWIARCEAALGLPPAGGQDTTTGKATVETVQP